MMVIIMMMMRWWWRWWTINNDDDAAADENDVWCLKYDAWRMMHGHGYWMLAYITNNATWCTRKEPMVDVGVWWYWFMVIINAPFNQLCTTPQGPLRFHRRLHHLRHNARSPWELLSN
jgi:hypothetical protein